MITFGILQGRLSPAPNGRPQAFPWTTWVDEFAHARAVGFDSIEWLVTAERPDENPLVTDSGVAHIRRTARDAGLAVSSVCADCFIPLPLVGVSTGERRQRVELLARIVRQAARLDARVVVLPLLESNAPADEAEAAELLSAIAPALSGAAALGVRIALETSWPGTRLRDFIAAAQAPSLGACYDIGNAAAFGLDPVADLRALGPLVAGVHVKDRRRTGESMPLGEGDADLAGAIGALEAIGYAGAAILETPVGADPAGHAARNLTVARQHAFRGATTPS